MTFERFVRADQDDKKKQAHADVARRYKLRKPDRRQQESRMRIGGLTRVYGFRTRYGGSRLYEFSDDDAGREDLRILLDHYALSNPAAMPRIAKTRAPWMSESERAQLIEQVGRSPRYWTSKALAKALNLTKAERLAMGGVPTICACDVTDDERKAERRRIDRERKARKRRAAGITPHAASASQTKPWESAGFRCRRTWERHGKPGVANLSAANVVNAPEKIATTACTSTNPGVGNVLPFRGASRKGTAGGFAVRAEEPALKKSKAA